MDHSICCPYCKPRSGPIVPPILGKDAAAILSFEGGEIVPKFSEGPIALPRHREAAHHESGHAVVGILFGKRLGFVSIQGPPAAGFTSGAGSLEKAAIVSMAGPAAEMLEVRHEHRLRDDEWLPHFNVVLRSAGAPRCDHCKLALYGLSATGRDERAALKWLRERENETFRLLREKPVWKAVTAVAEALNEHGTLSGPEVEAIVSRYVQGRIGQS